MIRLQRTQKVRSRSEILPGVTWVAEEHVGEVESAGWVPAIRIFLENRERNFSTSFRLEVQQLIPVLGLRVIISSRSKKIVKLNCVLVSFRKNMPHSDNQKVNNYGPMNQFTKNQNHRAAKI